MTTRNEAIYSQGLYLLTLKGKITIEFMDGNTLEGEYAAQDALNLFVMVDNTPLMIPRSQIRYIKGKPQQDIEEDHLLAAPPATTIISEPEPTQDIPHLDDTLNIEMDHGSDEADSTVVLPEEGIETLIETATTDSPPQLFDTDYSKKSQPQDNEEDFTMVISPEQVEEMEVEEDEATFVLSGLDVDADTQEVKAYLDCITGPHAGEVFKLMPSAITIGRSTDNVLPLPKDKEISRKHTKISYESGQFVVEDQGSLNGTFINNQRISNPHYLEEGDVLMVGVSTLIYHKQ
jgi:hypothetical protein